MKVPFGALTLAFVALLFFASPRPARADVQNDIFQVLCMTELDVLEVRELQYLGETVNKVIKHRNEQLAQVYGVYSPKWNVDSVFDADQPPEKSSSAQFRCSLSGGTTELKLAPVWIPRSSGKLTIALSLRVAGRLLVDEVPFVLCRTGGPIIRFVYNAGEGYFWLEGEFGGLREREPAAGVRFNYTRRLFFIEEHRIEAQSTAELKWRVRAGALRSSDIDYAGLDYDNREKEPMEACLHVPYSRQGRR